MCRYIKVVFVLILGVGRRKRFRGREFKLRFEGNFGVD